MPLTTKILKGSPEYTVTDTAGVEIARAHCVNVPANLFTLAVGGKWSGVASEAVIVARLKSIAGR